MELPFLNNAHLFYHRLYHFSSSFELETNVADGEPASINHVVTEHYEEGQMFCACR